MRKLNTTISPAAYGGGIPVIHPPNYTAYYMRAMMHQQAKQQALSQYYDKVQSGINPQGVRDVDMDGFQKRADEWNKFGIENRDNLVDPRRDGGKALAQFNTMHRTILGYIQKSKQAAAQEITLQRNYSDPKKAALATKNDLLLAHQIGAPVDSPEHYKADGVTPHDLSEFSFNAPPYDANRQKTVAGIATRGLKPDRTYGKPQNRDYAAGTEVLPYTEKHSSQNLQTIGNRIGDVYDGDKGMQAYYENKDYQPDEIDSLRSAYKTAFPKDDIMDAQGNLDHRKVAQAAGILDNSQQRNGQEIHTVPRIPQGRGLTQEQQKQQYMMGWVNQMATAIKSGDKDEVNRLGAALNAGTNKNSSYLAFEPGVLANNFTLGNPTVKQGYVLRHQDNVYDPVSQTTKQVVNQDEFDPSDPALIPKLAGSYQRLMGATPSLKTSVVGATLNPGATPAGTPPPAKPPVTVPHGALDNIQ